MRVSMHMVDFGDKRIKQDETDFHWGICWIFIFVIKSFFFKLRPQTTR